MSDLQKLTEELMCDPAFKTEYDAVQPEIEVTRALLNARIHAGLSQVQLSELSGISQADISRLEKGTRNPTIALLKRLADAMGMTLQIRFVPKQ
ncbi:MAG: helix-turn-helix transcriptional regulator [Lachnospiraceae bacterium]|nr:helix-turn-helix transcriptional regulator [Lachnospiraceae bacterium]